MILLTAVSPRSLRSLNRGLHSIVNPQSWLCRKISKLEGSNYFIILKAYIFDFEIVFRIKELKIRSPVFHIVSDEIVPIN